MTYKSAEKHLGFEHSAVTLIRGTILMRKDKPLTPAVKYFFKKLEKKSRQIEKEWEYEESLRQSLPFNEVEVFFRQLMTQNIFIHTVGMNGKHESTILSKAVFSMNKVVRVYYSTSFDEGQTGFIRIRPDRNERKIVIERMHGYRPSPEVIYMSADECHIVRFMVRWLMRRIDWSKTKLNNLDMYKRFQLERQKEIEAQIAEAAALKEEEAIQKALEKHQKKGVKDRRKSSRIN